MNVRRIRAATLLIAVATVVVGNFLRTESVIWYGSKGGTRLVTPDNLVGGSASVLTSLDTSSSRTASASNVDPSTERRGITLNELLTERIEAMLLCCRQSAVRAYRSVEAVPEFGWRKRPICSVLQ